MKRPDLCLLLAALLFAAAFSGCGADKEARQAPFTVDFLSTGKSDCALIRMDGLVILSDTADADDYETISRCLKSYGIEKIDYMVLSHYDKDHIGAAAALIRYYTVDKVVCPDYHEYSDEYYALVDAVSAAGTERVVLTEDLCIRTENGSLLIDPPDQDYGDDNNCSILTTVTYRDHGLVFMGDAMKKRLEEYEEVMGEGCDLIKLPHHGDSSKPLLRILRVQRPKWAVEMMSAAETVEPKLLECLRELDVPLYSTADGPVHLEWNGEELAITQ